MKNTATTVNETLTKCYLVIYDSIPQILMPCVAYRRAGRQEPHDVRVINCPYCNKPLTEVSKDTKVVLYRYPTRKKIRCQAYPVCKVCKNEVGIILA